MQSSRKVPLFPGAVPIDASEDVATFINQTGQSSPTNALLGKPSHCRCKHGYPQAFSLDPVPPTQKFKRTKMDRLNSGLLKLTCPLLVSSVDLLEDDGFMKNINSQLALEKEGGGEDYFGLLKCMDDAHNIHSAIRKMLVFGDEMKTTTEKMGMLESRLGELGAKSFLDAGVAGANPSLTKLDVKCLHAWLGDYLFRKVDDCMTVGTDRMPNEHQIGDLIVDALKDRGIEIMGTDTCHQVCSGCNQSKDGSPVRIPIPRNKQRRKRRQADIFDSDSVYKNIGEP